MTHTLISFLGRVQKGETGYRITRYTFDGEPDESTAFIRVQWVAHQCGAFQHKSSCR